MARPLPAEGWFPFKFVNHSKMFRDTEELFKQLDIDISPDTLVGKLSVSKIQSIEIAKAVSFHSQIIVMDEPTSSLTSVEVEHLFRIINDLKKRGVSIIYISHKMEEILRISDDVTIMRDGKKIGTWPAAQMTTDLIISKMVGRDLTQRFPDRHNVPNGVIMKVDHLTSLIRSRSRMCLSSFEREKYSAWAVLWEPSGPNWLKPCSGFETFSPAAFRSMAKRSESKAPAMRNVTGWRC